MSSRFVATLSSEDVPTTTIYGIIDTVTEKMVKVEMNPNVIRNVADMQLYLDVMEDDAVLDEYFPEKRNMKLGELKRGSYFRFVGIGERDVYFLADSVRAVNLTLPTVFPLMPIKPFLDHEIIRLKVKDIAPLLQEHEDRHS